MTIPANVKRAVDARAGGRCEAPEHAPNCNGRAERRHHRKLLSQGGSNHPSNIYVLSLTCHTYAHEHSEWAREVGIIISGAVHVLAAS